jgi:bacillithiol biosynthesis cysteine-adding enzyme BshC
MSSLAPEIAAAAAVAAARRACRPLAPAVHRALAAQQAGLAPSPARDAHLAALARGAAAVVTGQQVGLFLGPLYTIYKAASAVAVARALADAAGVPVAPVFWLQTEDHDLPEIASCGVPHGAACEPIGVPVDPASRTSIAHLALPPEVERCLAAVAERIEPGAAGAEHVARLRRHYRAGARWADAFAGVLAELFAPEGLVVIDPRDLRDPALAAAAAPVHARALELAGPIATALIARGEELARAGRPAPVHVRPGAPLSFFHPAGAAGPRVRLESIGADAFTEVGAGRAHTRAALLAALGDDPLRFSTSALLRPLVQDAILPTAAYVGGPGELAYLEQLPPVYRLFDQPPPVVLPRARFRVVDVRARRLLDRLGITAADAERPEPALLDRLRPAGAAPDAAAVAARLLAPFLAGHAALAAELGAPDPGLTKALARTRGTVERAVGRLGARVERAASYADAARVDAVRRLQARLAPGGAPQERVLGLPAPASWLGDRPLVARVLAACAAAPFAGALQELA